MLGLSICPLTPTPEGERKRKLENLVVLLVNASDGGLEVQVSGLEEQAMSLLLSRNGGVLE